MNKHRRADINRIKTELEGIAQRLSELAADIDSIKGEEEESYENLPEGLQASEQGERSQAASEALGDAHSEVEGLSATIDEAVAALETAAE